MTPRNDPLASTRIRLEGRLEHLEAAPEAYEAHAQRPTARWTREDVEALAALEERTRHAAAALRHLFPGAPLPAEEGAVLYRLDRARRHFVRAAWARLTGEDEPPDDPRALFDLLDALHLAACDVRPLYERVEVPRYSWEGEARIACRLSKAGLIVGERFVPAHRLLEVGVRLEPGGPEGLPDRSFVDALELPYRDQVPVRTAVAVLRDVARANDAGPTSWVLGGTELAGAWVFFCTAGAFVCPDRHRWPELAVEGVARALDGAAAVAIARHLREAGAWLVPIDDVQSGLKVVPGDRVRLLAREPVLEIALGRGDAERLAALVRR
ncbi:MAG: hypothetical protein AB1730_13265 [Myxococcota bacterium]